MRISDSRYSLEVRGLRLAARMLSGDMRTHTIAAWAGVSTERVNRLLQVQRSEGTYRGRSRERGRSYKRLGSVLTSASLRREAGAVAGICRMLDVLPANPMPHAKKRLPGVERGEGLCDVHDLFTQLVPHARLTLEQWVLVLVSLAEGEEWNLAQCVSCPAVVVVDRLAIGTPRCESCERDRKHGFASGLDSEARLGAEESRKGSQLELFGARTSLRSVRQELEQEMVEAQDADATDGPGKQTESRHVHAHRGGQMPKRRGQNQNESDGYEREPY